MPDPPNPEVTALLLAWGHGDDGAFDRLVPMVHAELRRLPGGTWATSAVDIPCSRPLSSTRRTSSWSTPASQMAGPRALFRLSSRLMRQVLVDWARARGYQKRGAGAHNVTLDEGRVGVSNSLQMSSPWTTR